MIERNHLKELLRLVPKQENEQEQHLQSMLLFVSEGTVGANDGIKTIFLPSQEQIMSVDQLKENFALIGAFVERSGLFGLSRTSFLVKSATGDQSYQSYRLRAMGFASYILDQQGDDQQLRNRNFAFLEKNGLPLFVIGFWRDSVHPNNTVATLTFPGGYSPAYARDRMIDALSGAYSV